MRENLLNTGKVPGKGQGILLRKSYEHFKKLLKTWVAPFYIDLAAQFTENRQVANRVVVLKSRNILTSGVLESPAL